MFWLKMIPSLLGVINYFIQQAHDKELIDEGYQKAIDEQVAKLNKSMQAVADINNLVDSASSAELAELLNEYGVDENLEPVIQKPERSYTESE